MKAPARSELMAACYQVCTGIDLARAPWGASGPHLLTQAARTLDFGSYAAAPNCFCPIHWWHFDTLFAAPASAVVGGAFGVHLWNDWWRKLSRDKDAQYPGTWYEALLADHV